MSHKLKPTDQNGFIPMMICLIVIMIAAILFAYMRVHAVNK